VAARDRLTKVHLSEHNHLLPTPGELRGLDPGAWEAVYLSARPALWRFARSRLATSDQAEDAVSETMVRAIAAIGKFNQGPNGLIAWLVGIERNVINEMYRQGSRLRSVPSPGEIAAPDIVEGVIASEEADALRIAFARLPSDDQELLGLRVLAGLDSETTARVLGRRPGAVRMAQARALGRLRVTLREDPR
jgi:RNA polymerase sigma-70 factor, ECF subfamily